MIWKHWADLCRSLRRHWVSLLFGVGLLPLAGGLGCANKVVGSQVPDCPPVTSEMIVELWRGSLDYSPAIEDYLGRMEAYCDAVRASRG